MRAVLLEVPEHMLAERRRLGHDRFDEMWEGELHMVPPPSAEHQLFEGRLLVELMPHANARGLKGATEVGLFDPAVGDFSSYRQPDLAFAAAAAWSERGIEGAAALVIEVRSPGDESIDKIPFYSRVGVAELLIIDRDTKDVRRWSAAAGGGLLEQAADAGGWHGLAALPVRLRADQGLLLVDDGKQVHRI